MLTYRVTSDAINYILNVFRKVAVISERLKSGIANPVLQYQPSDPDILSPLE
jgi:hypothetical protein